MDPIALRGFAQILPQARPSGGTNTLSSLMRMQQMQQEAKAKRDSNDDEWLRKTSADIVGTTGIIPQLAPLAQESLASGKGAMEQIYYQSRLSGGLNDRAKAGISQIKSDTDRSITLIKTGSDAVRSIMDIVDKDKEDNINRGVLSQKMADLVSSAYRRESDGSLSVDPSKIQAITNIMSDPDIYSDEARINSFTDKLNKTASDAIFSYVNPDGSTTTGVGSGSTALFMTDEKGNFVVGRNGKPIPDAKPEVMVAWDSDPINKRKLDKWTQEEALRHKDFNPLTDDPNIYRATAFKKKVTDTRGRFEIKSVSTRAKDDGMNATQRREKAAAGVFERIYNVVNNPAKGKQYLGSLFGDDVKVEYENGGIQVYVREKDKALRVNIGTGGDSEISRERIEWKPKYDKPLPLNEVSTEYALLNLSNQIGRAEDSITPELYEDAGKKKGIKRRISLGFKVK